MMRTASSVEIAAEPRAIYDLVEDIARWPTLLPHYRFVKVLREEPAERIAIMAARRGSIPVRWTAAERLFPGVPRIEFTHVAGWTKGMEVAWRFEPVAAGTRVTIDHELDMRRVPLVGDFFARRVIGDFFIHSIANATLARFKQLMERPT